MDTDGQTPPVGSPPQIVDDDLVRLPPPVGSRTFYVYRFITLEPEAEPSGMQHDLAQRVPALQVLECVDDAVEGIRRGNRQLDGS